jgi:hypothetical protein
MDENTWLIFLKNISLVCNWVGLLAALAFLFGPKLLLAISRSLDKPRRTMNIERLLQTKARVILGLTLLIITIVMLTLITNVRV